MTAVARCSRAVAALAATGLLVMLGAVPAAWAAKCTGGQVPLDSGQGEDLEVTGDCAVGAGQYHYKNVNIYGGGRLEFEDAPIDFWAEAILVENEGSLIAGSPEAPIGTLGGTVTIHLYGAAGPTPPRFGAAGQGGVGIVCKSPGGICGIPLAIWQQDPSNKASLPGGVSDYFYRYTPLAYDDGTDEAAQVGYFGRKVLAVSYGGTLQLFGAKGATYRDVASSDSGTSWVRLARTLDPESSDQANELLLDRPVDWERGDEIVVTTTDYLPGHSEQLTIEAVSDDGRTVTVAERAKYLHNGEAYSLDEDHHPGIGRLGLDLRVEGKPAVENRAAVALLTRSIRIVSAGSAYGESLPSGPGEYFGGHTMVRQGAKIFQMQGVEFKQLGQGGRMGSYPVHFHMARKTPPDTFVKDCSVNESMTRWYVLHATHNVTLARNVGYKSIGHGYYLEDGTEINNKLHSNIGIFARAAVDNAQNPRRVPGILSSPDTTNAEQVPFHSDFQHPAVFWIMNGWNEFEHNMAVGAGTCGVCYWLVPGANSGMSRKQTWESYASAQSSLAKAAVTPLKTFSGNFCSTAMTSFQTVGNSAQCNGVGGQPLDQNLSPIVNPLVPSHLPVDPTANKAGDDYYPKVDAGGGRFATRCDKAAPGAVATGPNPDEVDCSAVPRCSDANRDGCLVTVLDRYTSAFHWAETANAAIWLRPQWYLVNDSILSDVQNAGLTFVSGGDYTQSSIAPGHWMLVRKSVFIGNTQEGNPFASNAGPFNAGTGLTCEGNVGSHCLSKAEGISIPLVNFGNNQRLFSIYDGPAQQDSNAYLDITRTVLGDCAQNPNGTCSGSRSMYGKTLGVPYDAMNDECYLPNAAIAWKQPNGFYYPPAFHSTNLYFDNVDIRHFVIQPSFEPGTFVTDVEAVKRRYCTWGLTMFDSFTDIDRQTVLNDDDGSLTGSAETISVNIDPFFTAPIEEIECRSDETAVTNPYEHVTTAVFPGCAANTVDEATSIARCEAADWSRSCSDPKCYGVPMYRQYITAAEDRELKTLRDEDPVAPFLLVKTEPIRLMQQDMWQRNNMTTNHGRYYIDTTVSKDTQVAGACRLNLDALNFKTANPGLCSQPDFCASSKNREKMVGNISGAIMCDGLGTAALRTEFCRESLSFCTEPDNLDAIDASFSFPPPVNEICQCRPSTGPPSERTQRAGFNVFRAGETYYVFLVYAKSSIEQTYQLYVGCDGSNFAESSDVWMTRTPLETANLRFTSREEWPAGWTRTCDPATGVLTVAVDMDFEAFKRDFASAREDQCRPKSFCAWDDEHQQCGIVADRAGDYPDGDAICRWAGNDIDCPEGGCFGFAVKLPDDFVADDLGAKFQIEEGGHRPPVDCYPDTAGWNLPFDRASAEIAGACFTPATAALARGCEGCEEPPPLFCSAPAPPNRTVPRPLRRRLPVELGRTMR